MAKTKIKTAPGSSKAYNELLGYINDHPDILSALYDLDLMPEQVSNKRTHTSRMTMLAFVWGYQVAKGEIHGQ